MATTRKTTARKGPPKGTATVRFVKPLRLKTGQAVTIGEQVTMDAYDAQRYVFIGKAEIVEGALPKVPKPDGPVVELRGE